MDFWISFVAGTLIGSALGFMFGVAMEMWRQAEE